MSLQSTTIIIIKQSGVLQNAMYLMILITVSGYVQYQITTTFANLITGDVLTPYRLSILLGYKITLQLLEMLIGYVRRIHIRIKLEETTTNYLWTLVQKGSLDWLQRHNEYHSALRDGARSVTNSIDMLMKLLKPLLMIFSEIGVVFTIMGNRGLWVIMVIITIKLIGLQVLKFDWSSRKDMNKSMSDNRNNMRNLSNNFFELLINGLGTQTRKTLISSHVSNCKTESIHGLKISVLIASLEILEAILVSVVVYMSFEIFDSKFYTVILTTVQNSVNYTWWIFHSVNSFLITAADWATTEKLFNDYSPRSNPTRGPLNPREDIKLFQGSDENEVSLFGQSGAGKSTYMRRLVVDLTTLFGEGSLLYLIQRMALPKTDKSILEVMGDFLPDGSFVETSLLLTFAKMLNIDNIINSTTVHSKFSSPSPGEEKRILILRAFLPILMGITKVKVIFADEITAGLDEKNFLQVRELINHLKNNFGIFFVTIDHHKVDGVRKLQVKKKVVQKKVIPSSEKSKKSWMVQQFQSIFNRSSSTVTDSSTDIVVWIPDIEDEPV